MQKQRLFMAALALSSILTGCSKGGDGNPFYGSDRDLLGVQSARGATLQVSDESGAPLVGAQVLIGEALDQPFASNFITTDSDGHFKAPSEWTSPQIVTVAANGYVRASFFNQMPSGQTFQLRPVHVEARYELKGKGTGFKVKDSDNIVDFALMVPAIKREDLFSFDLQLFISPQSDVIDVYGQKISLPSNVSLPRQKENYSFFPVTLQKPVYRMYFDALGRHRVLTIRGQFPFREVVGEMQDNKTFFDVINQFSLKGGSIKDVDLTLDSQTLDLPVDELAFTSSRSFQSPSFQSDEFLMAAALSSYQGDLLPTDFKNVPANSSFQMVTAAGTDPQLVIALKKKSEQYVMAAGQLSAAVIPFDPDVRPELLPLIEKPVVLNLTEVHSSAALSSAQVKPVATYLLLSAVTRQAAADVTETTNPLWEVYVPGWQNDVKLPQWPGENFAAGAKRWEITYLGSQNPKYKAVDLSPRILETVTHATHSATDF